MLSPTAASFTPGGGGGGAAEPATANPSSTNANPNNAYMEESFTESSFLHMVEGIDDEMDHDDDEDDPEEDGEMYIGPPSNNNTGVELPSHLAAHAKEFWFPDSRDCTCCKGFKYGCDCCVQRNLSSCRSCSSGSPAAAANVAAAPHPSSSSSRPAAASAERQTCKFFQSPGGCRFGDRCRFAHA